MELYVLKLGNDWVHGIRRIGDGDEIEPDAGEPNLQNLRWSFTTAHDALEAAFTILGDEIAYRCTAVPFAEMIRAHDQLAVDRYNARLAP